MQNNQPNVLPVEDNRKDFGQMLKDVLKKTGQNDN